MAMMALAIWLIVSVGVTPGTTQLGVTPRTLLLEGKNLKIKKPLAVTIRKGRLLLVNDHGFSQIALT